jgi:hypothetical protein
MSLPRARRFSSSILDGLKHIAKNHRACRDDVSVFGNSELGHRDNRCKELLNHSKTERFSGIQICVSHPHQGETFVRQTAAVV